MRSIADVMPDRVSAGTSAHIHFVSYNGFNKDKGEYWVYLEVDEGSYGGRCGKDAIDSCDALVANTRNVPIEEIEWHYPLRVERYELNLSKVAPGKWRGGLGIVRETHFLQEGTVTCKGDILQICTPCGGGYGNPFERDPELVLGDVLDGFTDIEDAKESYGAVIDASTMKDKYHGTCQKDCMIARCLHRFNISEEQARQKTEVLWN